MRLGILLLFFIHFQLAGQNSEIDLNGSNRIQIFLGLDSQHSSNNDIVIKLNLKNNSANSIFIYDDLQLIGNFNFNSVYANLSAYYTYDVSIYDSVNRRWLVLNNDKIFNDIDYVEGNNKRIEVLPKQIYSLPIVLTNDLNIRKRGLYKVKIFLGVKSDTNTFVIFKSNEIEIRLP